MEKADEKAFHRFFNQKYIFFIETYYVGTFAIF